MDHTLRNYDSMLELLSNADNPTPIVRLRRVVPHRHATFYAKLEWYNPFGSVKDRVAANLIHDAEEKGLLKDRRTLVEPTSGNTGMGLAMLANAKGYRFTATMSSAVPEEKRAVLRLFGSQVMELSDDLCPAPGAPEGAIALAAEMAQRPGHHQLNQYKNPANPDAHFRTTGPEIWRQTAGRVTHFAAGLGTCGTITGTGRYLKAQNPRVQVVGVHPAEGHDIPGVRSLRQLKQTELFFPDEYDGLVEVDNQDAFRTCQRLNLQESIIAGPSSGMALAGALRAVPDEPGVVCVVIFPDNAFKYATSFRKHLSELFGGAKAAPASDDAGAALLRTALELARTSPDVIDVGQAEQMLSQPRAMVLDVRSPEEFMEQHIENAVNVPLDRLAEGAPPELPAERGTAMLTVCGVGEKSLYAMLLLKSLGYRDVKNLMGGMQAWLGEGMPTMAG